MITIYISLDPDFVEISAAECPCAFDDRSGCEDLPKCSYTLIKNDLCLAKETLPDGNGHYDVNNCGYIFGYDVFRFVGGKFIPFYG